MEFEEMTPTPNHSMRIVGALAVVLALYCLGMCWSFHREHQAQIREHALLLQKIDEARAKHQRLQAMIKLERRRTEILLRQKGMKNPPGDFWMPGELDRLRMRRNAAREG